MRRLRAFAQGVAALLASHKDTLQALQAIATVVAVIVGGIWTYDTFVRHRQDVPWATVENTATHRDVTLHHKWIEVQARVTNHGLVALSLSKAFARVTQIRPVRE